MRNLKIILLFFATFCSVSCQQKKVSVENNSIYFRGEKILEGNEEVKYEECIFLEKQNVIVFVKKLLTEDKSFVGENGVFLGFDDQQSGIYIHNVETGKTEQVVSFKELGGYLYGLLKLSDNSFCFSKHDFNCLYDYDDDEEKWNYSLDKHKIIGTWNDGAKVYRYDFSTKATVHITDGGLVDIVTQGKYKNNLVVGVRWLCSSPCDANLFFARILIDENGNFIGCLGYEKELDSPIFNEIDYRNIKFKERPLIFEDWLNASYVAAKKGLKSIEQYYKSEPIDKNVLSLQIDETKNLINVLADEYNINLRELIFCDYLSAEQMQQVNIITNFVHNSETYNLPFRVELQKHRFFKVGSNYFKESICYGFSAIVINQSNSQYISAELKVKTGEIENTFWGGTDNVYDYPKVQIALKNKTISQEAFLRFKFDIDNVSINNAWKQGESREISLSFVFDEIGAVHFEYMPKSCVISIPFTAEDATGKIYTTYFKYDILNDWQEYAKLLKEKK